jgi:hypothetical protein
VRVTLPGKTSSYWKYLLGFALLVSLGAPIIWMNAQPRPDAEIVDLIPKKADWVDYGTILNTGEPGSWNYYLHGAFAVTAIKKDGVFYLYYQGASGYRSIDETVTGRAIGVAVSTDGINFTEYQNNPILSWSPSDGGEEGTFSSGATVYDETVFLFYGAMTEESPTTVNADTRVSTSSDGINFSDRGVALSHRDGSIWGSGDELFPIIAIEEAGRWFVYYLPNGVLQGRKLGVAWGDSYDQFTDSARVQEGWRSISAWGTGGFARLTPGIYALFLNDIRVPRTDVRIVSLAAPHRLSAPVTSYDFDDYRQATILLDEETRTWFMYYRNSDETKYGVKLAPAGALDLSPPTVPSDVTAYLEGNQLFMSWEPAVDPDTGIVHYRIYRDGIFWTSVKGWTYEAEMVPGKSVVIWVTAVNYHGVEGPPSESITIDP